MFGNNTSHRFGSPGTGSTDVDKTCAAEHNGRFKFESDSEESVIASDVPTQPLVPVTLI